MKLHEYYFGGMCGENMDDIDSELLKDIEKYYSSFERWKSKL
jgi:hypothetical protein